MAGPEGLPLFCLPPKGMFRLDGHCEAGAPGELCRFKEMSGH